MDNHAPFKILNNSKLQCIMYIDILTNYLINIIEVAKIKQNFAGELMVHLPSLNQCHAYQNYLRQINRNIPKILSLTHLKRFVDAMLQRLINERTLAVSSSYVGDEHEASAGLADGGH